MSWTSADLGVVDKCRSRSRRAGRYRRPGRGVEEVAGECNRLNRGGRRAVRVAVSPRRRPDAAGRRPDPEREEADMPDRVAALPEQRKPELDPGRKGDTLALQGDGQNCRRVGEEVNGRGG